jgi:site-specific DNA-methyltransferase (adenine-specific)
MKTTDRTAIYASDSANWRTPPKLIEKLVDEIGVPFSWDLAATKASAVAASYCGPDHEHDYQRNGLHFPGSMPLSGRRLTLAPAWLNPPFSRRFKLPIEPWLQLCVRLSGHAGDPFRWTVYALIPSRTDTVWWHRLVLPYASEIRSIKGRIRFLDDATGEPRSSAPFPSALVVYRPGCLLNGPRVGSWDFR